MGYPGALDEAVLAAIAGRSAGGLRGASERMSAAYRKGAPSSDIDLAAYLTARLPATFAVNRKVMAEVAEIMSVFAPTSLADVGAGPGTAGWAALAQWPTLAAVEQVEASARFADLLVELNGGSGLSALEGASLQRQALSQWQATQPADLVVVSYMLAEMPNEQLAAALRKLWAAARRVLVLVEPGTPEGFRRILAARKALLEQGAHLVGPCTHEAACPMAGGDWCHFKERVQRSRAHMHAKGAAVPYEDEPYSYLVLSRDPLSAPGSSLGALGERVLASPRVGKIGVEMKLCGPAGLANLTVPSRDKAAYKRAKKAVWGARWTPPHPSV